MHCLSPFISPTELSPGRMTVSAYLGREGGVAFVSLVPCVKQGFKNLSIDSFLFLPTEIFSKRRKIYAWF